MSSDNINLSSPSNPSTLHVPNSVPVKQSFNSIMDAYNSQSKVQLYDDNSGMSCNDISGVKGRDIPLSALRPKQPTSYDEQGKPVYSKSQIAKVMKDTNSIKKAYRRMQTGESVEDYDDTANDRLSQVEDAEIEYIEDVPDDNNGILHYLDTCIKNAEANLEMLKSLYAALN